MEQKIRQYVEYQFRFDNRDDIEDLKEEIIANLIDRYQQYIDAGKDENLAYIEAIKSMGDFSNDDRNIIPEEYRMKPSIPDILLMSAAILSIFGLIITLINGVTGTIITALSIILFSGSAYYLYSYSQYVKKEYMDIEKHNLLLVKIFKYMKTSFVFWAISLSLTLASIVSNIISYVMILNTTTNAIDNVKNGSMITSLSDFKSLIILNFVIFIILLIVLLLIFRNIYERLMNHYYNLTGDRNLHGKIHDSYKLLYGNNFNIDRDKIITTIKKILLSDKLIPLLGLVIIIPYFFMNLYSGQNSRGFIIEMLASLYYGNVLLYYGNVPLYYGNVITLLPILAFLTISILIIITFVKCLYTNYFMNILLIISYYVFLGSIFSFYIILLINFHDTRYYKYFSQAPIFYSIWLTIILSIILFFRKRIQNKESKDEI